MLNVINKFNLSTKIFLIIQIIVKNNSFINEKIYSKLLNKNISVLWIPQTIRNLNCNKLLIGDFKYIAKEKEKRISINEVSPGFSTSCSHIKKRGYYPDKPLTLEEEKFPLAFAINVYTVKNFVFFN